MLINEGASESLQSYYELVRDNDLSAREELLLHRKRLSGLLVKNGFLRGYWEGCVLADCL